MNHNCRAFTLGLLILFMVVGPILAEAFKGQVLRVVDGDTIDVLAGAQGIRVRLIGIDSPEIGQSFGDEAKRFVSELIFAKQVILRGSGKDRYGRMLADVTLADGSDLSRRLVAGGKAWWYRKYALNDRILELLHNEAREARRGLWVDPSPTAPWDFRHGRSTVIPPLSPSTAEDKPIIEEGKQLFAQAKECVSEEGNEQIRQGNLLVKRGEEIIKNGNTMISAEGKRLIAQGEDIIARTEPNIAETRRQIEQNRTEMHAEKKQLKARNSQLAEAREALRRAIEIADSDVAAERVRECAGQVRRQETVVNEVRRKHSALERYVRRAHTIMDRAERLINKGKETLTQQGIQGVQEGQRLVAEGEWMIADGKSMLVGRGRQLAEALPAFIPTVSRATSSHQGYRAQRSYPEYTSSSSGTNVWVNLNSGIYHLPGSRWYGKTKRGRYMTEADAIKYGAREARMR